MSLHQHDPLLRHVSPAPRNRDAVGSCEAGRIRKDLVIVSEDGARRRSLVITRSAEDVVLQNVDGDRTGLRWR